MIALSVTLVLVCLLSTMCTTSEVIPPVSTSVMLGGEAKFCCSGEAFGVVWTINDVGIGLLGIQSTEQNVDGVLSSTITVIGSAQYDNASIQCFLIVSPTTSLSLPPVFLTVLGIGQVPSIKLVSLGSNSWFIKWEEPVFVSTDVTDLMYNVLVSGVDSSPVNVTTKDTECCHDMLTTCQVYNITVTPFSSSSNYVGASNGTEGAIDGDMYRLSDSCKLSKVEFMDADSVTCTFVCQVEVPQVPCPAQCLHMLTTAENEGFNETSIVYFPIPNTTVEINATGLHAGEHYRSKFSIKDHKDGVVDKGNEIVSFSTSRVRDATFSRLPGANIVNVTCTFATNAFASACMARFENAPLGLAFNGTIDHSKGLLNSSGNVTIPPEVFQQEESHVTFDVKVFDVDENGTIAEKPAIEKTGALEVVLNDAEPPDTSTQARGASTTANPSVSPSVKPSSAYAIIAAPVAVLVLIVLMVLVLGTVKLFYFWARKKRCSVNFKSQVHSGLQIEVISDEGSLGAEGCGLDAAAHATLGGGEETTHSTQTPSHTYSSVKRLGPKLEVLRENVHPQPLEAQSSPVELDGEKVEHVESKKGGVVYAELGPRPANAPPVLPPDTCVHYMTVQEKPTPKDTDSHGAEQSDLVADHAHFVGGEELPHPQQSAPTSCHSQPTVKQPRPNPRDAQYEKVDSNPSNAQSSPQAQKDGVMYAELGSRPTNAPPVLPPYTSVHYMTVNQRPAPKDTDLCETEDLITFSEGGDSPHPLPSPAPSFTFSPGKKRPKPNTGIFQYETVHPQPSIAQSSPHQLGGKKAEHIQSGKGGVVYAELGARPANAPVVLPPAISVHYMSVRKEPMPKDKSFHGSSTSVDMRATVSSSNASFGNESAGLSPPCMGKQSREKEGISLTVPFLADKQSQEKGGEIHAHEEWEDQAELEIAFCDKATCTTTAIPEFGQHRAILTVGGEPSGLRAAGVAGQSFAQMVFTTNHVPKESEVRPVSLVSRYMSKAAVGGVCSETDENADTYLTTSVQESGLEQSCELVMVEGEHYQEEVLLEKPCLDKRKMTWELTEQSVLSYERRRKSSFFACAVGDQCPCMCIPQEESSPEKPCQDEYKVTQKLTEQNVLSKRRQMYSFFTYTLGNQNPSTPQKKFLSDKACQDEYKMTQNLTEKIFLRKRHQKFSFFAGTLGNRNPSIPQEESSSEKPFQDENETTCKLTGKSFLSNRHQKSSFFGCTFGNQSPGIPQKQSSSEKPCQDKYKMDRKLTEESMPSYPFGNQNLCVPSSVLCLFFHYCP